MARAPPEQHARNLSTAVAVLVLVVLAGFSAHVALLSESAIGPEAGLNNSDLYESSTDAWFQPQYNVTQLITSGSCSASAPCLWVPWYGSSSSCIATGENESGNLKTGSSCDSGEPINATNNCMVSDEFSQVGLDLSMGRNQTRFWYFHNTVNVINSSRAKIPAWRVYRGGNTIYACRTNINGNCDTAGDATARIIIAHWNAANNSFFSNQTQKNNYAGLALNLTIAMVQSEITLSCKNSTIGSGPICYWLRAGNQSSLTSTDGGYTGYYADVEIALLQTCSQTGNLTYCAIAGNISLNEKQAAKWNGSAFSAPPGRSYKWDNFSTASVPYANCTNTCGNSAIDGDETWDASDAIREFFEGTANYYDRFVLQVNVLANSTAYMGQWVSQKMIQNLNSVPIQYYPNGNDSGSNQSGYVAQAMQAAGIISQNNATQVNTTVWNAMDHYSHSTHKWDSAACPGVYNTAFPIRMLGVGMGRDAASFGTLNGSGGGGGSSAPTVAAVSISPVTAFSGDSITGSCNATDAQGDNVTYEVQWFNNGVLNSTDAMGGMCYQESANVSSTCGTSGTGSYVDYYSPSRFDFFNNMIDGNASTSGRGLGSIAILDIFYAIPSHAQLNKSYWQVKDADGTRNLSLNDSNLIYTPGGQLALSVYDLSSPPAPTWAYILASEHNALAQYQNASGLNGSIYEEGMWWNTTTFAQGSLTNVSVKANVAKGDVWIMGCRATDTNGFVSAWANSSGLTVSNTVPVNTWNLYNQSFNHNASMVFGNYCSDADVIDTLVYSTNNTVLPILANGSINFTANVTKTGNYSLNVSCSDSTANVTVRLWINVTNNRPNVTSASLSVLPAQAGLSLNLSFVCTDPDNDVCNATRFYNWFKNGLIVSTTNGTLASGNFTTGDNITGSVRVSDGNLNSSWQNTSVATIGDTTPPVLSAFGLTPTSTTTSGTVVITANCTDNNQIGTVSAEVTDANSVKANFTMSNTSGSTYEYDYGPPIAGTYSAKVYCTDGNGNIANTTSTVFTVTQTVSSGGGGGGGGGTITITQGDHCDFSIVRPTNGFVNTLCPAGQVSGNFEFVLQNEETTSQTYTTAFKNVHCTIDQDSFTVVGKGQHSSIIGSCTCPTNVSQEGSIVITTDVCTGELPIKLYNGLLSRILFSQDMLINVLIVFFALAIIAAGIIFAKS